MFRRPQKRLLFIGPEAEAGHWAVGSKMLASEIVARPRQLPSAIRLRPTNRLARRTDCRGDEDLTPRLYLADLVQE